MYNSEISKNLPKSNKGETIKFTTNEGFKQRDLIFTRLVKIRFRYQTRGYNMIITKANQITVTNGIMSRCCTNLTMN